MELILECALELGWIKDWPWNIFTENSLPASKYITITPDIRLDNLDHCDPIAHLGSHLLDARRRRAFEAAS